MGTYTLQAVQSNIIKRAAPTQVFNTSASDELTRRHQRDEVAMLVSFEPLPESLHYKKVVQIDYYGYVIPSFDFGCEEVSILSGLFKTNETTFTSAEEIFTYDLRYGESVYYQDPAAYTKTMFEKRSSWNTLVPILRCGVRVNARSNGNYSGWHSTHTSRGTYKPYIVVHYEDAAPAEIDYCAPRSGYLDKAKEKTFSWGFRAQDADDMFGTITQTSAVFKYKSSESGEITETNCGTNRQITVPGGTFATDDVYWQVSATASDGTVVTSEWYKLTTIEVASTSTNIAPPAIIADGNKPIVFKWKHNIGTGTAQTKFELQTSTDGTTYTDFATQETAEQTYTAPANSFLSGDVYWRVRTYNSQSAEGEWSTPTKFVVIASPPTPVVAVDENSPRPVISWQSVDQQAHEVLIGKWKSGLRYGTERSLRCGEYLADGEHTAKVRVQNQYGLWSEYGAVSFTVGNVPGEEIALEISATHNARLFWNTVGNYDKYYVYRNGELIAKTKQLSYEDNTSIGDVTYYVRGAFESGGNYALSPSVSVSVKTGSLMIGDLLTGEWQELTLAEVQGRETGTSMSREVTYMKFAGQKYPSVEISEFASKAISFVTAFADKQQANKFELLSGRLVCVKSGYDEMVVGILESIDKTAKPFYAAYSSTVTQINYPEVVDYD